MERRKFVLGLGSLAAGGAAAMGTGAFSQVQADRGMDVTLQNDANAYLRLIAPDWLENGEYADGPSETGAQLTVELDSDAEVAGNGPNVDARSLFDEVFRIVNQGNQDADVFIKDSELSHPDRVRFYDSADRETIENGDAEKNNKAKQKATLPVGGYVDVGIEINTRDFEGLSAIEQPQDLIDGDITVYTVA